MRTGKPGAPRDLGTGLQAAVDLASPEISGEIHKMRSHHTTAVVSFSELHVHICGHSGLDAPGPS